MKFRIIYDIRFFSPMSKTEIEMAKKMAESKFHFSSPLSTRYCSDEMSYIFSDVKKFRTWRNLWLWLAQAQKQLGLDVTEEQIEELQDNQDEIDLDRAHEEELKCHHDVMAHVKTLAAACPLAAPIIHLGATSAFVTDNGEIIQIREAMELIIPKIAHCINQLAQFSLKHKSLPTLGLTHLQPAQLTTVGKRATLWTYELFLDFQRIVRELEDLRFRGLKGTTGTQASFLRLMKGSGVKVKQMEEYVARRAGFTKHLHPITGQTYTRKMDYFVVSSLAGLAQSMHKICTDIRLLASRKEIEEPFEEKQIGSSAMPYKRNPMLSERCCSLSRHLMTLVNNTLHTAANQWMERTLDDSANRRITIGEAFMCAEAITNLMLKISSNLVVYPKIIQNHIDEEFPFMASENIIVAMVELGHDRQEVHEEIRILAHEAGKRVKMEGKENDLIERIKKSKFFPLIRDKLPEIMDPASVIGRAPDQVEEFITHEVMPVIEPYLSKNFETPSIM